MIESLVLNGKSVNLDDIDSYHRQTEFEKHTLEFITQWMSGVNEFIIKTSGSTGEPKTIFITREQMLASARATNTFFNLKKGDIAHLCLNTKFIAGQMMLVRAMVNSLKVIGEEPSAHPEFLTTESGIHFSALIPLQAKSILKEKLKVNITSLKGIIIGGAAIDKELENFTSNQDVPVYSTFGMTETVSHIALKALNGPAKSDYYTVLPGVEIGCKEGCLTVKSAVTNHQEILTNDRVEIITPSSFRWLGRKDNVVNSGGVKIQLEQVERVIERIVANLDLNNRIICAAKRDSKLGERLVLIVEGALSKAHEEHILKAAKNELPKYWSPKVLMRLNQFAETATGKIDRQAIKI